MFSTLINHLVEPDHKGMLYKMQNFMGIFLLGRPPLSMMTLINFTKHSTYVYDKRCRLGSCWLGEKIVEFWVEKQGCLPPMLPPNFFTILYVVENFTKFTYYVKNRDVCCRSSTHQTLLLTVWSSHQLISAHFFDLGKQIRVLGQQQEAFGIKRMQR